MTDRGFRRAPKPRRERPVQRDIDRSRGGVEEPGRSNYEQGEGPTGRLEFDRGGYSRGVAADDGDHGWDDEDSLGYARGAYVSLDEEDNQGTGAWTQPPPGFELASGRAGPPWQRSARGPAEGEAQDSEWTGRGPVPAGGTAGYGAWPTGTGDNRPAPGPHTGKGPRGYQRSDQSILEDVCERLAEHGDLDASDIRVEIENGVVRLSGEVRERWARHAAEDMAFDVPGVKDVFNSLRVAR